MFPLVQKPACPVPFASLPFLSRRSPSAWTEVTASQHIQIFSSSQKKTTCKQSIKFSDLAKHNTVDPISRAQPISFSDPYSRLPDQIKTLSNHWNWRIHYSLLFARKSTPHSKLAKPRLKKKKKQLKNVHVKCQLNQNCTVSNTAHVSNTASILHPTPQQAPLLLHSHFRDPQDFSIFYRKRHRQCSISQCIRPYLKKNVLKSSCS